MCVSRLWCVLGRTCCIFVTLSYLQIQLVISYPFLSMRYHKLFKIKFFYKKKI